MVASAFDLLDNLLIFCALAGTFTAGIRIWLSVHQQERVYEKLAASLERLAAIHWLPALQAATGRLCRILNCVYGRPIRSRKGQPASYFTLRAWKVSSWIAIYLLLGLPIALFTVSALFLADERLWSEMSLPLAGAVLATHVPFLAATRSIDWNGEALAAMDLLRAFVLQSFWAAGALGLALFVIFVGFRSELIARDSSVLPVLVSFSLVFLLIYLMLSSTYYFGFFAPVAVTLQLLSIGLLLFPLLYVAASVLSLTGSVWQLGAIGAGLVSAGVSAITIQRIVDGEDEDMRYILAKYLVALLFSLIALVLVMYDNHNTSYGTAIIVSSKIVLGIILPALLVLFSFIFANSIPDWISVAYSRYFLGRASSARTLSVYLSMLLLELGVAALCVLLTFVLLAAMFSLSAVLFTEFSPFPRDEQSGLPEISDFLFGWLSAPQIVSAMADGQWNALFSDSGRAGATVAVSMFLLSMTSLVPAIVNALVMSAFSAAKLFSYCVAGPARKLQGSLWQNGADGRITELSRLRASAIIGLILALAVIAALIAAVSLITLARR